MADVNAGVWQVFYKVHAAASTEYPDGFTEITYALNTPTGVVLRHVAEVGDALVQTMVRIEGEKFVAGTPPTLSPL